MNQKVRWGILGTAHIAESAFLPALRAAGGRAYAVAGREHTRTEQYAQKNGIERAHEGYKVLVDDPEVEAVYVPLPNSLHAEWTIAALEAGKAVLCEKPLCASVEQAARVLEVARHASRPLWEAFVFPFHRQQIWLQDLVASGAVGTVREIHSQFHFRLRDRNNIRLAPELAGGALHDLGCYPIHFAQLVFRSRPLDAVSMVRWAPEGVDEDLQAIMDYGDDRRLVFSCGMTGEAAPFTRVVGETGEIRMSNPFHARRSDTLEVVTHQGKTTEHLGEEEPSFTQAIRHIHAVLAGEAEPRHTALDDSIDTETGLNLVRTSMRQKSERVSGQP